MDVISEGICLQNLHILLLAQRSQNFSYISLQLPVDFLPPVLRRKHYMVLASVF